MYKSKLIYRVPSIKYGTLTSNSKHVLVDSFDQEIDGSGYSVEEIIQLNGMKAFVVTTKHSTTTYTIDELIGLAVNSERQRMIVEPQQRKLNRARMLLGRTRQRL